MNKASHIDFDTYKAAWVLGILNDAELIDMAACALVEGYDTRALRILAAETEGGLNAIELHRAMGRVLAELKMSLPTHDQATLKMIQHYAQAILDGGLTPQEGIDLIYDRICCPIMDGRAGWEQVDYNVVAGLVVFCHEYDHVFCYDVIDDSGEKLAQEQAMAQVDQKVREEMAKWVALEQLPEPPRARLDESSSWFSSIIAAFIPTKQ